jgi:mRNA interferase YafQ
LKLLEKNGHNAIPSKMKPHTLQGQYRNYWKCHIFPDLLLIWIETEIPAEIYLVRIGSHAELFE